MRTTGRVEAGGEPLLDHGMIALRQLLGGSRILNRAFSLVQIPFSTGPRLCGPRPPRAGTHVPDRSIVHDTQDRPDRRQHTRRRTRRVRPCRHHRRRDRPDEHPCRCPRERGGRRDRPRGASGADHRGSAGPGRRRTGLHRRWSGSPRPRSATRKVGGGPSGGGARTRSGDDAGRDRLHRLRAVPGPGGALGPDPATDQGGRPRRSPRLSRSRRRASGSTSPGRPSRARRRSRIRCSRSAPRPRCCTWAPRTGSRCGPR